ncbi:MAG: aldose 1-epimerase [Ilumatobacter sp.]
MIEDVTLSTSDATTRVDVVVAPRHGGRVRSISVTSGSERAELLIAPGEADGSLTWGCYPMAPWAGRLRHGRFEFMGDEVLLDLNHADGGDAGGGRIEPPVDNPGGLAPDDRRHTIHGTTYDRLWDVVSAADDRIEMTCPIDGSRKWPFPGLARQLISVRTDGVDFELTVEPTAGPFPATVGWHPWFARPKQIDFEPLAMYRRDEIGVTTDELLPPVPPPWDDCFINHRPVRLHYDRGVAPTVTVTSPDCDHWVVFDGARAGIAVEPQSGPPNAPNVRPDLASSDRVLRRTMTISW